MKTQQQQTRELKRKLVPLQTPEDVENIGDAVASLLVAGSNVSIVYNDPSNTITISSTGGSGGGGSGTFMIDDGTASTSGTFYFDDGGA
jgi:hypothetical protein